MKSLFRNSLCALTLAVLTLLPVQVRAADFLIIVDSSGSMSEPTKDGQSKMDAAKEALRDLKGDLAAHQLGMTVFGHRIDPKMPGACQDVETVLPIADFIDAEYDRVVNSLRPKGNTPLAASLHQAATELMQRDRSTNKIVIVVTDGNETCGGDPVAIAQQMQKLGINIKVHVIGFGVKPQEQLQLQALAKAGAGEFGLANTKADLESLIREQIKEPVATIEVAAKPALSVIEKALVRKLEDENRDVRTSAAKTLSKMKAVKTLPFLTERLLQDADYYAWHAAAATVAGFDADAFEAAMLKTAQVKADEIRHMAVKQLATIKPTSSGPQDLSAVDAALVAALQDSNRDIRTTAGKSLLTRKTTGAVQHLAERITIEGDYYAWHSAIEALNGLDPSQAVDSLVAAVEVDNSNIRKWATDWMVKLSTVD